MKIKCVDSWQVNCVVPNSSPILPNILLLGLLILIPKIKIQCLHLR